MGNSNKRRHEPSEPQPQQQSSIKRQKADHGNSSLSGGQGQSIPPLPAITEELSKAVFTHSSIAAQDPDSKELVNYERLEFLGDAYLELMSSEVIYERYNSTSPGKMSALRESLVRNDTLHTYAMAYDFPKKLRIALGSEQQAKDLRKVHADVFEAYVAAVVRSDEDKHKGYETAKAWMTQLWEPTLKKLGLSMKQDIQSKEMLAKALLAPGIRLDYRDEKEPVLHKSAGLYTYTIGVYLTGWGYEDFHLGTGVASSKKEAGQQAAHQGLRHAQIDKIKGRRWAWLEEREKAEQAKLNQESGKTVETDAK